ncbi:MAG: uncharacterized protein JWM09_419 [Francisellaceae bacterium]|nr:uncharacterized protein [Francisellaceae bacterium]
MIQFRFMTKSLKYLCISLFIAILLSISIVVSIILFINPNDYKEYISQKFYQASGHQLAINGPINWFLSPNLGLQLNNVSIQTDTHSLFALNDTKVESIELKKAKIFMDILPLLTKKLVIDSLALEGLILNIEQDLPNKLSENALVATLPLSQAHPSKSLFDASFLMVKSLTIEDSTINISNSEHELIKKVEKLNLDFKKSFLKKTSPFEANFNLINSDSTPLATIKLKGLWDFDFAQQQIQVADFSFFAKLLAYDLPLNLSGKFFVNLKPSLKVEGLLNFLSKHESIKLPNVPKHISFDTQFKFEDIYLELPNFDMRMDEAKLNGSIKMSLLNLNQLPHHFSFETPLPIEFFKNLSLESSLNGQMINLNHYKFTQINLNLNANQGVLKISPLEMDIAGKKHFGNVTLDVNPENPVLSLSIDSQDFEINDLLSNFNLYKGISGLTHFKGFLRTQGKTLQEFKQHLSGHTDLHILDGKIYGLDLESLLKSHKNILNSIMNDFKNNIALDFKALGKMAFEKWSNQAKSESTHLYTNFTALKASSQIQNSIVNNQDLLLVHPHYKVMGKGSFDIKNAHLNYQVEAFLTDSEVPEGDLSANFMRETPLTVDIQGPLNDLSIHPDINKYFQFATHYFKKNLIIDFTEKSLKKIFNNIQKKVPPKNTQKTTTDSKPNPEKAFGFDELFGPE